MGYESMGDVASTNFVMRSGVAKATNVATLAIFKNLQRQINRLAVALKRGGTIAEDGDIGFGTLSKFSVVRPSDNWVNSVQVLASKADVLAKAMSAEADKYKVPTTVAAPVSKPPTILQPATGVEVAVTPDQLNANGYAPPGGLGSTGKLLMGVGLVVASYLFFKELQKGGKRSSSSGSRRKYRPARGRKFRRNPSGARRKVRARAKRRSITRRFGPARVRYELTAKRGKRDVVEGSYGNIRMAKASIKRLGALGYKVSTLRVVPYGGA